MLVSTPSPANRRVQPDRAIVAGTGAFPPGTILDGFRLDRLLGHGGMGVVYAGWDLTADRPAAIKLLGGAITSEHLYERFRREAAMIGRLRHPGIVELYQLGQSSGVCYIAMEQIAGTTLRDWLERIPTAKSAADFHPSAAVVASSNGLSNDSPSLPPTMRFDISVIVPEPPTAPATAVPLAPRPAVTSDPDYIRRVVEVLRDLADAIDHAHTFGIVHRDLKPENVMLRSDGRVVVIDFGLARSFADTTLTTHSGLLGTPLYMAPEQLRGRPAGPAADVYALGLIGYELLSNSLPFRATTMEGLFGDVLYKSIPPLAGRNAAVPAELAAVIHRATAKQPADRYPTAREFADELTRYLTGGPVTAPAYRYPFEARDVTMDRPRRLVLIGLVNMGMCGFCIIGLLSHLLSPDRQTATYAGLATLYGLCGWRMFTGRSSAGRAGWATVALTVICLMTTILQLFRSDKVVDTILLYVVQGMLTLIAASTSWVLLSRRTRDWYARMRQKEREYEAERNGSVC
jgi:serine/threonine protein kinase